MRWNFSIIKAGGLSKIIIYSLGVISLSLGGLNKAEPIPIKRPVKDPNNIPSIIGASIPDNVNDTPKNDAISVILAAYSINKNARILFASADVSVKEKALQIGAVGFLKKPFSLKLFLSEIESILDR